MSHSLNIFLLLFGALQGLILSFFLLLRKKRNVSQLFIVLFLVVVGLQLTFKVITKTWLMENVLVFYKLSYCLPWLVGPLVYLFFKYRHRETSLRWNELLHFLPFMVLLALTLLSHFSGRNNFSDLVFRYRTQVIGELVSLFTYGYLSWRLQQSTHEEKIISGLRHFLFFVVAAETVIIITLSLMQTYYGRFPDVRWLFIVLTLLIYWITYKLIDQPELFMGPGADVVLLKVENNSKYAHSGLRPPEAAEISEKLIKIMQDEKLYLQSGLTIDALAASLDISRHYVSQVINEQFHKSYFDFISGFRLEEARARLANPKYAHYTIAAIAHDSGFSSVSSFNETFKKHYRLTPSRFREQQVKTMSA